MGWARHGKWHQVCIGKAAGRMAVVKLFQRDQLYCVNGASSSMQGYGDWLGVMASALLEQEQVEVTWHPNNFGAQGLYLWRLRIADQVFVIILSNSTTIGI